MSKCIVISRSLSAVCALAIMSAASVSGCTQPEKAASQSVIADFDPAQHSDEALAKARWQIAIHSGAGIPGSPGADQYYPNARKVLQTIVDDCALGATVHRYATDGVSVLIILDDALSEAQIACARSSEAPGIRLRDRGAEQADSMEDI